MAEHTDEKAQPGVWLIYDYDRGPYAQSIHASAAEAAREAAQQGYGRVGFWPLGMELGDAVKVWENPSSPPEGSAR